jgi:hypothetical protein
MREAPEFTIMIVLLGLAIRDKAGVGKLIFRKNEEV